MELPTEIFGDVVVVHSPEDLSDDHARAMESFIATIERNNIVLDVDSTESIDSEGLETLLDIQDSLIDLGGDLKISTTNNVNRKIFEISRLDQQLEVYDSVIDAVKSFV